MTTTWAAPTATRPVDATVRVPGSKSMTNRAVVLAALADAPTVLGGPLTARDTALMAAGVAAMGAEVQDGGPDWTVTPAPLRGPASVDCGLAGTVMRFLPPVAALADGPVHFDGDPRARQRPMAPLVTAMRALGVDVDDGGRACLPFTVRGTVGGRVRGGQVRVDASASSQFVSGLLLAGCRFDEGLRVVHVGPVLPSAPHVQMTVAMLRARGVPADLDGPRAWSVGPAVPTGGRSLIEPDLSAAFAFAAAALVTGGCVRIPGLSATSAMQPVALVRTVVEALGGRMAVSPAGDGLVVDGRDGLSGAGELDLSPIGELTPVVAALAAMAPGRTTIRGVAHLRGHETDRLAALATELSRLGGSVTQTADGLDIRPAQLHAGQVHTYQDHRIAMAAAVLGLAVPGIAVVDVATTAKTFPGFVQSWLGMLAQ